jgi:hypothetical protein
MHMHTHDYRLVSRIALSSPTIRKLLRFNRPVISSAVGMLASLQ